MQFDLTKDTLKTHHLQLTMAMVAIACLNVFLVTQFSSKIQFIPNCTAIILAGIANYYLFGSRLYIHYDSKHLTQTPSHAMFLGIDGYTQAEPEPKWQLFWRDRQILELVVLIAIGVCFFFMKSSLSFIVFIQAAVIALTPSREHTWLTLITSWIFIMFGAMSTWGGSTWEAAGTAALVIIEFGIYSVLYNKLRAEIVFDVKKSAKDFSNKAAYANSYPQILLPALALMLLYAIIPTSSFDTPPIENPISINTVPDKKNSNGKPGKPDPQATSGTTSSEEVTRNPSRKPFKNSRSSTQQMSARDLQKVKKEMAEDLLDQDRAIMRNLDKDPEKLADEFNEEFAKLSPQAQDRFGELMQVPMPSNKDLLAKANPRLTKSQIKSMVSKMKNSKNANTKRQELISKASDPDTGTHLDEEQLQQIQSKIQSNPQEAKKISLQIDKEWSDKSKDMTKDLVDALTPQVTADSVAEPEDLKEYESGSSPTPEQHKKNMKEKIIELTQTFKTALFIVALLIALTLIGYFYSRRKKTRTEDALEETPGEWNERKAPKRYRDFMQAMKSLLSQPLDSDEKIKEVVIDSYNLLLEHRESVGYGKLPQWTPDEYRLATIREFPNSLNPVGYVTAIFVHARYRLTAPSADEFRTYLQHLHYLAYAKK